MCASNMRSLRSAFDAIVAFNSSQISEAVCELACESSHKIIHRELLLQFEDRLTSHLNLCSKRSLQFMNLDVQGEVTVDRLRK